MDTLTTEQLFRDKIQPLIMGILNVTPDSFSDGGNYQSQSALARQIDQLVADGADIIDVGGESTRPFAEPVSVEEELHRVIPAIETIRRSYDLPISIDTTKARVASEALAAGANIINDISALRFDRQMIKVATNSQVPVIIMHMQGTPQDMQVEPTYNDVIQEISAFFQERIAWLQEHGLTPDRLILDPGIGFGKSITHNLSILKHSDEFNKLGCPVLIGHSRKSFIGKILNLDTNERDAASAVISAFCATQGAAIVRVHDVKNTADALRLLSAIRQAP